MALDPQVEAMRRRRAAKQFAPLYTLTVAEARAADLAEINASAGVPESVGRVVDDHLDGPAGPVPIRVYQPDVTGPLPVLVYFFGGGWTLGTIETSDAICRRLANAVPCVTVAVGYRLAPEHKFPAALEDCHAAIVGIAARAATYGGDPSRLAVGGDSAGANLAAATCLLMRDRSGPALAAQLLVYPNTCYQANTPSMRENTDEAFFNKRSSDWYWGHYLASQADGASPYASPLLAEDLTGLPPALIITAEYDPLRDEGEQYALRLAEADVDTACTRYDGMVHGFFAMGGDLDAARSAQDEAAEFLHGRLDAPSPARRAG